MTFVTGRCVAIYLLVGLLGLAGLTSAAAELPYIPNPPGLVEVGHVDRRMEDLATIGHLVSEKLVGVYLKPSDLNNFASTGRLGGAIVCRAYLEGEYASVEEARAAFQKTVAALRRDSGPLNLSDPDVARVLDGYRRAAEESLHGASVAAVSARADPLVDLPNSYSSRMTAAFDVTPPPNASNHKATADPFAVEDERMERGEPPLAFNVTPPPGASNPETTTDPFAAQIERMQRGEPPPETGAARIRIYASIVWIRIGRQILQISAFGREDARTPAETDVTVLHWLSIIEGLTPAITYSDDRFVEVDEDAWIETFDLKTVTRLLPGKYLVTSTQTYPPDVMKQKLTEQDVLESYCDKPDGKYPAPSALFTLGPPDMPVMDIEVQTGTGATSSSGPFPTSAS